MLASELDKVVTEAILDFQNLIRHKSLDYNEQLVHLRRVMREIYSKGYSDGKEEWKKSSSPKLDVFKSEDFSNE